MLVCIKQINSHQPHIDVNIEYKKKTIGKLFEYMCDERHHLFLFGPRFTQLILKKLNEFIDQDIDVCFSHEVYEYKKVLLPYLN